MKLCICLLALLLLGVSGCGDKVSRYLDSHPDLSLQIKSALEQQSIVTGMTKEECLLVAQPDKESNNVWEYYYIGTIQYSQTDTGTSTTESIQEQYSPIATDQHIIFKLTCTISI